MSGLVVWLIIIVFFVSLNRVFGAVGRNMTGEEDAEGGRRPGPGGDRPGRRSVGSELLREIAKVAEREARARAEGRSGSEIRWRPGLGGGAPLGAETGARSEEQGSGARVLPASGAPVGAGSREIGSGPLGSFSPRSAGVAVAAGTGVGGAAGTEVALAGTGLTGAAGRAASLPAWPDRTALQRAVLYEAILGPPLALRGEPGGPPGA